LQDSSRREDQNDGAIGRQKNFAPIRLAVLIQYRSVTDTDGRTELPYQYCAL